VKIGWVTRWIERSVLPRACRAVPLGARAIRCDDRGWRRQPLPLRAKLHIAVNLPSAPLPSHPSPLYASTERNACTALMRRTPSSSDRYAWYKNRVVAVEQRVQRPCPCSRGTVIVTSAGRQPNELARRASLMRSSQGRNRGIGETVLQPEAPPAHAAQARAMCPRSRRSHAEPELPICRKGPAFGGRRGG